jgi:hypothetical protein
MVRAKGPTGLNPSKYMGVEAPTPPNLVIELRVPTTGDYIGFNIGDLWLVYKKGFPNIGTAADMYILISIERNVAHWVNFAAGGMGGVQTLTGDIGGVVFPDGFGNIDILGDAANNLQTVGNPGATSITVETVSGNPVATDFETDFGTVSPDANGLLKVKAYNAVNNCGETVKFLTGANKIILDVTDGSNNVTIGLDTGSVGMGASNTILGSNAFQSAIGGSDANTAVGFEVLQSLTTGSDNVAIGSQSLNSLTTGTKNIGIGRLSLFSLTTTSNNVAIGDTACFNCIGSDNTAVGYSSLFNLTTGNYNTALGSSSLLSATTGSGNTSTGFDSLNSLTTGGSNTANGYFALQKLTTGSGNVAVGSASLSLLTTASDNVAVGTGSLQNSTTGTSNTAVGYLALQALTTSTNNTSVGYQAGKAITTAANNTIVGSGAGVAVTTSNDNVIIGKDAAAGLTTGTPNIVIGTSSGSAMTGAESNNILIGHTGKAGKTELLAIGYGAGATRFIHNYPGSDASTSNGGNTFIGGNAGNFTLAGAAGHASNNGFGAAALLSLTTGYNNDSHGSFALSKITTGFSNVGIGPSAGFNSVANTGITTGSYNVIIGSSVGDAYTGAESNNILIGANVSGVVGESNIMRIGDSLLKAFIDGIRGVTTDINDAIAVKIDSAGQLGTVSSSIRYKDNVQDMDSSSSAIFDLRPVTFEYKKHPGQEQRGLIAEEVDEIMPELVVYDKEGLPESVKYDDLPVLLLNELQKLKQEVEDLKMQLLALK